MRILHIMAGRGLGGAETYSTDVMLSLHQAGVDQCVVIAKDAPRYEELKAAGLKLAPDVLDIPFALLKRRRMRALIDHYKPDIIHCWMRRAASLVPALDKSVPVIGWFGGYYDPAHFTKCTHFVGVTKDIAAHMVAKGIPFARAFYIPTFPDIRELPPIDRKQFHTPAEAKILLTLSRLHPKKGLDVFLRALKELPDCVGWIAGDGPLRHELHKLAVNLDILERVRFLGWRTDRSALLQAADICVLPSRYEPFGTVILEAWAAKVPLVACASAGPAAHVTDGVTGMLSPIDDVVALTKNIRHVLDDNALREKMIAEGHEAYLKDFTRMAVTKSWQNFYQALMAKNT